MSNAITPLQRLCLDHYCEGRFKALDSMQQVYGAGDGLLTFLMLEAAELSGPYDLRAALHRAEEELRWVRNALENER
jgi:hypothetical protein